MRPMDDASVKLFAEMIKSGVDAETVIRSAYSIGYFNGSLDMAKAAIQSATVADRQKVAA